MQIMGLHQTLHIAFLHSWTVCFFYYQFYKRISNCQEILLLPLRMEVNCVLFCFLSCCNQSVSRICGDQTGIMSLSLQPGLWVSYTPTAVIPELVTSTKREYTIREPDVCFLSRVSLVFPFSGRQSCLRCTFAFILPCFFPSPTEAVGAAGSNLQRNSAVLSSSAHTGVQRMLSWS